MRTSLLTLLLAGGVALAGDGFKPVTYVDGVDGVAGHTPATLNVTYGKTMILHAKEANLEIPYAGILKAERTTVKVEVAPQPMYKVWTLSKKLIPPDPRSLITLQYQAATGPKTLMLEMDKSVADRVMEAWTTETDRRSTRAGNWWGDANWKTPRNKDQWRDAGAIASR